MTVRTLTLETAPETRPVDVTPIRPAAGLGARVRQLRVARGLTQGDLASDRFSKEYISQIERGKTRPTAETLIWVAERLGVDSTYLQTGHSWCDYRAAETAVAQAEAAVENQRWQDAREILSDVKHSPEAPELELRALLAQSWAQMYLGDVRDAIEVLTRARAIAEGPGFSDLERADVLFRIGCCRYKLSSISSSQALFKEALELAEGSGLPCDRLRSDILGWRSRCYRRQRDWEAAREDIERALELADALEDRQTVANVNFQASLVAERSGQWLRARKLAERAKSIYEELEDRQNVGRLMNNLGGLNFLLGKPEAAVENLKHAFGIALELGSDVDAAQAVSSLAQVHLREGRLEQAEEQARHALELLAGREDYLDEIGNAQIVLGRALLEQGRLDEAGASFHDAETSLLTLSSASHSAVAWTAQGDLAARRGDDKAAAGLYRRAAESLQDVRF